MAEPDENTMAQYRKDRVLLDPYLDWAEAEGVPVLEDFGVDLLAAETAPWARFGCNGAIINLKGRGNFCSTFLFELTPGANTAPLRHLFEAVYYVLEGHGSTRVETHDGASHTFEWGPKSLFALPVNAPYQMFNGSGTEPVRIAATTNAAMVMNLYHSDSFVFDNDHWFAGREGAEGRFAGDGEMTPIRPGRVLWDTNFVPDVGAFELKPWDARGVGSGNMQFILADGIMGAHASEMPVGTYKKGHRHGPGLHIFTIHGSGYTLLWYEGDEEFQRVEWRHGMLFAPPDQMFHQHFDTSQEPARYLAVGLGSKRYPVVLRRRAGSENNRSDVSIKKGGRQVEYEDQDPRIHPLWLQEITKTGVASKMGDFFDEEAILRDLKTSAAE
jgi:mannose-6-phosphate isomerase-like protein (cupin superfamily)